MSTQQDLYAVGSKSRPPMLNKENYVPWSPRLLRYAKSRQNGKLIYNSIMNGPYVRRMIPELDALRAERLGKTHDPLALMANSNNPLNYQVFHQDQPSSSTYVQQPQPFKNYNQQPSFNQNYMQQPMPNLKDILDPTTSMNMALALMDKAFKLNYSTPTNNNQRISSNPHNRNITQPGMNLGQDRQMQMVRGNGGNQFRQYAGKNGNVVAARAEGNETGNNENQIRCYNYRGLGIQLQYEEFDLIAAAADLDDIEEFNANCILMANLKQASTSGSQADKALVYDSNGSAELWHQRLSHLNFNTINDLARNDLVTGLLKFKYHKEHLCPSCEQGKSKKASHPPKPVLNSKQRLHFLHMDLCGPMRIASINEKRDLCYPKNDREDIEKLGAKGDIGFFIGYSANSSMAFEQRSLKPGLQSTTSGQISSGIDLLSTPSTITTQQPTKGELDLLFEAMYDGYNGGQRLIP
nr:ribonuclease H-like domain-containing protein [Tanacetum cinerariifolium]